VRNAKKKSRKARQPETVKAKPTKSEKTKVAKSTSNSKKRPAKSTNKPNKKQKKNSAKGSKQDSSIKKTKKKSPAKKSKKQAQQQDWALPTIKRTGSVSLQRGWEHVLEAAVGNIEMGLGWNSPFDIAAGVLVFDDKYQHVETVDWRALKSKTFEISHSGDVLNGAAHAKVDGDDEKVRVNLHTLPPNIVTLMFCAAIWTTGKTWKDVKEGVIRLVDLGTLTEKCRFELNPKNFGLTRAVVLCKVYKSRDGSWKMLSIGEPVAGKDLK